MKKQTRNGHRGLHRALLVAGLALTVGGTTGCTQVVDAVLALEEGSGITIELGTDSLSTNFEGGIDSTATVNIGFFDLLFGKPLEGDVVINDIQIAGEPFMIPIPGGGTFNSGTICVLPLDPDNIGGGTISINLLRHKLTFDVSTATGIRLADPVLGPALGVMEFPFDVSASAPITLLDLLGALATGGLPIELTQEISMVIDDPTSLLNGATVTGQFVLGNADAIPSSARLDECLALPPLP
jgi:hypothetical protein